jgi:hypothetical protein
MKHLILKGWKQLAVVGAMAAVLALGVTTATAGNGATVDSFPVSWTVPAGQCADFPTEVNGSGTYRISSATRTGPDGLITQSASVHAQGTATDAFGNRYRWAYAGEWHLTNSAAEPNVYRGKTTDTFSLAGNGPARTHVSFVADETDTFDSAGNLLSIVLVPLHVVGDPVSFDPLAPHCDPI